MGTSTEWQLDNRRLVKDLIKYKYFKTVICTQILQWNLMWGRTILKDFSSLRLGFERGNMTKNGQHQIVILCLCTDWLGACVSTTLYKSEVS